jgi:hypothetical protein
LVAIQSVFSKEEEEEEEEQKARAHVDSLLNQKVNLPPYQMTQYI